MQFSYCYMVLLLPLPLPLPLLGLLILLLFLLPPLTAYLVGYSVPTCLPTNLFYTYIRTCRSIYMPAYLRTYTIPPPQVPPPQQQPVSLSVLQVTIVSGLPLELVLPLYYCHRHKISMAELEDSKTIVV